MRIKYQLLLKIVISLTNFWEVKMENKENVILRINMIRQSEQNYQFCYKTLDNVLYK